MGILHWIVAACQTLGKRVVIVLPLGQHLVPGKVLPYLFQGMCPQFLAETRRLNEPCQCVRQGHMITCRHAGSVHFIDQLAISTRVSGNDGQTAGHIFENGVRQPLLVGAEYSYVGTVQVITYILNGADKVNPVADTEISRQVGQF
ncbi:hypothetical protein A2G06_07080 [Geobacter anodireducens]|nr:hypothetical protein A2G06_07080 [Geobacter anodireducens]